MAKDRRMTAAKRVALLGFVLESNGHAPVAVAEDFYQQLYLEGEDLGRDIRAPAPRCSPELSGFVAAMDKIGPWTPLPILLTSGGASGPVEHGFFKDVVRRMRRRLEEALPLDGVYLAEHGAATSTEEWDPDAVVFETVREVVGPRVPIVSTLDLHTNVSTRMVRAVDLLIG
jgi:microcystin degradation protein MlrC